MKSLASWRRERQAHPQLRLLFIELTLRCNECCIHCGSYCDGSTSSEIPATKLVETLQCISRRIDTDNTMLCITGGEPLVRNDFFDVMHKLNDLGYSWGMTTNGTLIASEVAHELARCGMKTASVSIDGLANTHDRFRRRPGSYRAAIEGIRHLLDEHAFSHIQVTTVVHKWNIDELDELFEELNQLEIDSWRLASLEPIGRALKHPDLMLDGTDTRKLLNFIKGKRREGYPIMYGCSHYLGYNYEHEVRDSYFLCNAGIHVASIMANGDIGSCLNIERRPETIMGNIYRDDFVDVWNNRFSYMRQDLSNLNDSCTSCPELDFCAGGSWHSFDFNKHRQRMCMKNLLF